MKSRKEEGGKKRPPFGQNRLVFAFYKRPATEETNAREQHASSFLPSRFAWSRGDNHETDATDEERELGSGWEISFAIDARVHSLVRGGRLLCFGNLKFEKRAGRSFLLGTKKGVGGWSLE